MLNRHTTQAMNEMSAIIRKGTQSYKLSGCIKSLGVKLSASAGFYLLASRTSSELFDDTPWLNIWSNRFVNCIYPRGAV